MLPFNVVRRGLQMARSYEVIRSSDGGDEGLIPPGFALLIAVTILIGSVVMFSVSYTYGHVIPALTMIESPETNAYVAVDTLDSSNEDVSPPAYSTSPAAAPKPVDPRSVDPDVLLIKNQPITSKLRTTIAHLRARAGYWSRFRGLTVFVIWMFLRGFVSGIFTLIPIFRNPLGAMVTSIFAAIALSTLHLTWIWIVISDPSTLPWYKRLPPFRRAFPKIAPAVAVQVTATEIANTLPFLLCNSFGPMRRFRQNYTHVPVEHRDVAHAFGQSILLIVTLLTLHLLLSIPATVTLTRVAASMLPDNDETIVPFDRSFGGKVTPAILGGQGKIGMLEAWRSFNWASRVRLLRVVAKAALIIFAVWLFFAMVLMILVGVVGGKDLRDAMRKHMDGQ